MRPYFPRKSKPVDPRSSAPKPNKFGARKVEFKGETFDSEHEFKRWQSLRILERIGDISDIRRQVRFALNGQHGPLVTAAGRQIYYIADFVYRDQRTGLEVIEDAKGMPTPDYKLKRSIMACMGLKITEV